MAPRRSPGNFPYCVAMRARVVWIIMDGLRCRAPIFRKGLLRGWLICVARLPEILMVLAAGMLGTGLLPVLPMWIRRNFPMAPQLERS